MLGKLKEVVSLSDEIRELKGTLSTVQKELTEIRDKLNDKSKGDEDSRIKEISNIKQMSDDISKIRNELKVISTEYASELNAFRITKKNIQERLHDEFHNEAKTITTQMSTYLSSFKALESQMNMMAINIADFNNTMNSMKALAKTVSEKDFELKNYARILDNNDREKVELLKKIDSLEKLMSAMKRSNRPPMRK